MDPNQPSRASARLSTKPRPDYFALARGGTTRKPGFRDAAGKFRNLDGWTIFDKFETEEQAYLESRGPVHPIPNHAPIPRHHLILPNADRNHPHPTMSDHATQIYGEFLTEPPPPPSSPSSSEAETVISRASSNVSSATVLLSNPPAQRTGLSLRQIMTATVARLTWPVQGPNEQ